MCIFKISFMKMHQTLFATNLKTVFTVALFWLDEEVNLKIVCTHFKKGA